MDMPLAPSVPAPHVTIDLVREIVNLNRDKISWLAGFLCLDALNTEQNPMPNDPERMLVVLTG